MAVQESPGIHNENLFRGSDTETGIRFNVFRFTLLVVLMIFHVSFGCSLGVVA